MGDPTVPSGDGDVDVQGSCALDERYLSLGAAAKDGIPAIDEPFWVAADDSLELSYLSDADRVVGFLVQGQPYAVPINILWYHEIVNASFTTSLGPLDLAVTHCPLTGTSIVFDRAAVGGAEFGVSGILYQSNLVMYDRRTEESLWPQMIGASRCGPASGTELLLHRSIEMRWDGWVSLYPDTEVLAVPGGNRGGYDTNPYAGYDAPYAEYTFSMPPLDGRLPPKARVLGVHSGGGLTWVFPFSELGARGDFAALDRSFGAPATASVVLWDKQRAAAAAYRSEVGGLVLSFRATADGIYDVETGSRWTVDGLAVEGSLAGERLEPAGRSYVSFWGVWAAFFTFPQIWGQRGPG